MPGCGYLVIRGQVPKIGDSSFSTTVRVLVDGKAVGERELKWGEFDLELPVPAGGGVAQHSVELEFTNTQTLPSDGRVVSAQLTMLGFVPDPLPPERLERFPEDLKKPLVNATGVYEDAWLAHATSFQLTQPPEADVLLVSGMVPKIGTDDGFTTDVVLTVDGREAARKSIGIDQFQLEATVPASADPAPRRIELKFSRTQPLPAPDGRAVGAKLISVGFHSSGG